MPKKGYKSITIPENLYKKLKELGVSASDAIRMLIEIAEGTVPSDTNGTVPRKEVKSTVPSSSNGLAPNECLVGKLGNGYWVICGRGSLGVVPNPCELEEKLGLKILNHKCR